MRSRGQETLRRGGSQRAQSKCVICVVSPSAFVPVSCLGLMNTSFSGSSSFSSSSAFIPAAAQRCSNRATCVGLHFYHIIYVTLSQPPSCLTPQVTWRRRLHNSPLMSVVFSPDGSMLATAGRDGSIWFASVSLRDGSALPLGQIHCPDTILCLVWPEVQVRVLKSGASRIQSQQRPFFGSQCPWLRLHCARTLLRMLGRDEA